MSNSARINLSFWLPRRFKDRAEYVNKKLYERLSVIHLFCSTHEDGADNETDVLSEQISAPGRYLRGVYLVDLSLHHPNGIIQLYNTTRRLLVEEIGEDDMNTFEQTIVTLYNLLSNKEINTNAFCAYVRVGNRLTDEVIMVVFSIVTRLNSTILRRHNLPPLELISPFDNVYSVCLMRISFCLMCRQFVRGVRAPSLEVSKTRMTDCLQELFGGNVFQTQQHPNILANLHMQDSARGELEELCRIFQAASTLSGDSRRPSMSTIAPSLSSGSLSLSSRSFHPSMFDEEDDEDKENVPNTTDGGLPTAVDIDDTAQGEESTSISSSSGFIQWVSGTAEVPISEGSTSLEDIPMALYFGET